MRELEIAQESRTRTVDTRYIGLFPSENGVQVEQGTSIEDSGDIAALDESIEQSDRYLEMDD